MTLRKAILFTLLFASLLALINYSDFGVAGLLRVTGGANILDFEFGYDYDKAHFMLTALGADGRDFYLTKIIPLDFLFPIAYMLCYGGWIALLLRRINARKSFGRLLYLPAFAMLFDWIENIGVIGMLSTYEAVHSLPVFVGSVSGVLKLVCVFSSVAVICILAAALVFKRRK